MYGVRTGGFISVREAEAYFDGVAAGLAVYAWHRDGTQYVGTTGSTLAEAQHELEAMRRQVVGKTQGEVAEMLAAQAEVPAEEEGEDEGGDGEGDGEGDATTADAPPRRKRKKK